MSDNGSVFKVRRMALLKAQLMVQPRRAVQTRPPKLRRRQSRPPSTAASLARASPAHTILYALPPTRRATVATTYVSQILRDLSCISLPTALRPSLHDVRARARIYLSSHLQTPRPVQHMSVTIAAHGTIQMNPHPIRGVPLQYVTRVVRRSTCRHLERLNPTSASQARLQHHTVCSDAVRRRAKILNPTSASQARRQRGRRDDVDSHIGEGRLEAAS